MDRSSMDRSVHCRPALFRALGYADPPRVIELGGKLCHRIEILKHDSWAATAIYTDDLGCHAACKFNRVQPILFLPVKLLGKRLGSRETRAIRMMQDTEGFPHWSGTVSVDGRELPNAVAHDWIEGRPFVPSKALLDREFFPRLWRMYRVLHERDIAHVDSSKWGNILVGEDGRPHLIDFQVHLFVPPDSAFRWLLCWFQAADRYHVYRNWLRVHPDQVPRKDRDLSKHRPGFIRLAEALGPAWRGLRILILRMAGVRQEARGDTGDTQPGRRADGNS
ncbi:MAG: hypothetical protein GY792_16985 [Gammaproteobacteria bacterium]|nr:hypothetical protein [Gammaproteobacteria bacterium]